MNSCTLSTLTDMPSMGVSHRRGQMDCSPTHMTIFALYVHVLGTSLLKQDVVVDYSVTGVVL